MKWFKKILAILTLVFLTSFGYSQGSVNFNSSNYYTWIKVGNPDCGKANFYIYVDRTYNSASRLYYYNIYFWSDSYYQNCNASATYISNIGAYALNGGKYSKIIGTPYILVKPKNGYFNGWNFFGYIYSYNPNQAIKIKWGGASLY